MVKFFFFLVGISWLSLIDHLFSIWFFVRIWLLLGSCFKSSILFLMDDLMRWDLKVLSSIFNYKIFLLIFMDLSNLCVPKYLRNLIIDSLTMCRVFALMWWTSTTLYYFMVLVWWISKLKRGFGKLFNLNGYLLWNVWVNHWISIF